MQIRIKKFYKISKNIFYFINKIGIKIFSQRAKKGFRDFALNSKKGVGTPSWRILGIKKCSQNSEQNKFALKIICHTMFA